MVWSLYTTPIKVHTTPVVKYRSSFSGPVHFKVLANVLNRSLSKYVIPGHQFAACPCIYTLKEVCGGPGHVGGGGVLDSHSLW